MSAARAKTIFTHSAAASVATLAAAGPLAPGDAVIPILASMASNTISKAVLAYTSGGQRFAAQVIPGLVLVAGAAWLGLVFTS